MNFSANLHFFFFCLKSYTEPFCDINHSYRLLYSHCLKYDNFVSDEIVSFMCYWLLHTCVRRGIFHSWCLILPLLTFPQLLTIPARILFSSNMPTMTICVLKGNEQDLVNKFLGTCFRNFVNISASIRVSPCRYRSWFCNSSVPQTLLACF